ncbi:sodium-independent sulfate anion transporter [Drosophila grimshawi]|uniref:sodium-independent sulfate anion transporter n=1 Tax=Drosophila grimshawi TaxID=7222 RepID=UPI001C93675B|nr:sodium-independent sulfate anion transporter [Drosophila grimshawi]
MYPQLEVDPELTDRATKVRLLPITTDAKAASCPNSNDNDNATKTAPPPSKWKRALLRHVPVFQWLPAYNMEYGIDDLIAGVTLGLTIIPESIACALLAGLPGHYGLCSAIIGPLIYLIFGSIDKVIIGPTSLVALVSLQFTVGRPIEFAILLTFLSGIVQIIMGSMRLGFIFEFISMPVIKAFSSATAVLVIESQLKVLLGIKYLVPGLINSVSTLSSRISEANMADLIMGSCAITFLLLLELLERVAHDDKHGKVLRTCCRYLSTSRNTLIVLIAGIVSYIWLGYAETVPYALSHNALSSLPNFTIPSMTVESPERSYSFWEILNELKVGIIVIPIVGILTNISIGKLTPKGLVDTNHELLALGLCNTFGSCVQAMPSSGAFTRYAISTACGLKTPMANMYLGIIVLLALSYLSPFFNYIPEATLAAILICSIMTLLDFKLPMRLWGESKRDFGIWVLCFCVCVLLGVEVGLFVSIIVTALHLLFLWARPEIVVKIQEMDDMQYISVVPGNGIYFPAINHLRGLVLKASTRADFKITVVIDGHKITGLDYTAAQGISKLSKDLCRQSDASSSTLLILYRFPAHLQNLIDLTDNLVFCENEARVKEFLTQESLRNGYINLKDHIRASIDLGYKIDID